MQIINKRLSKTKQQLKRPTGVYRPAKDFKEEQEPTSYQIQLRVFRIRALYRSVEGEINFQTLKEIQEEINQLKTLIEDNNLQVNLEELLFEQNQESGFEQEAEN